MTYISGMPEHSCPYIDEIIHWLDPDTETDTPHTTPHSELTRDEIIAYLRTINQELRDSSTVRINVSNLKYWNYNYEQQHAHQTRRPGSW